MSESEPGAPEPLDIRALQARIEQQLLGGARRYTRAEVAEATGTAVEDARRLWRALGFATVADDEVAFTDDDVEALRRVGFLTEHEVIDEQAQAAITRLMGQTFSRLAAWQGQLLVELVAGRPDMVESTDRIGDFVAQVLPVIADLQDYVWRRQLVAYFSRFAAQAGAEIAAPGLAPQVVGFVDMSGFTSLSRRIEEGELRGVLEAFEEAATDVVGAHGGRIVKTIGDEVLFVADSARAGAEIALQLLAAAADDDRLPPLRAGLAAGPVISRLGDVYGPTVNIASRLAALGRPGWVLVDRLLADALREDPRYLLKPRRPESVRGYHHLRQWRLLRSQDAPAGGRIPAARRR